MQSVALKHSIDFHFQLPADTPPYTLMHHTDEQSNLPMPPIGQMSMVRYDPPYVIVKYHSMQDHRHVLGGTPS